MAAFNCLVMMGVVVIQQLEGCSRMGRSAIKRATTKMPKKEPAASRKRTGAQNTDPAPLTPAYHTFTAEETDTLRKGVLTWYDRCKRDLPWRRLANAEPDLDRRAYSVWVSEVMLQQTQVSTVVDYYTKWMKTWPTLQDLAMASLEEVNEKWSGLGYYSRGRRLHQGAQKVVQDLGGHMPRTAEDLQKQLPGVGRYTAGAVASISYGQVTGVVDGNVIRVLCRLRSIGADFTTPAVTDALWNLANSLVDPNRPGDFNQAMMELGATVCTPKKALCGECPVQGLCRAYMKVELDSASSLQKFRKKGSNTQKGSISDIEECAAAASCPLCLPPGDQWDRSLGVANYPRKSAKKPSREEQTVTCVWERCGERGTPQYLLVQRPQKGLLAGMWEFPSMLLEKALTVKEREDVLRSRLQEVTGCEAPEQDPHYVGEVVHIFSHINQTYLVYFLRGVSVKAEEVEWRSALRWVTREEFLESAVPTAMKKILKLCEGQRLLGDVAEPSRKRKKDVGAIEPPAGRAKVDSKQRSIQSFFTATAKK
ncbi:adenine DNA glycosylase isoform X2 [Hyla sarda]|uniref:adenine DNA glycosylase isoform X2 n=1 Tax=Hyla sarda TaxID=327740 RepID=UPI0024C22374|nr:adenine DNA glycosylase isoform X2 [Hyla sarda]